MSIRTKRIVAHLGLAAAVCLTFPLALSAQDPSRVNFERYTLPNGLTVILAPDRTTQVVAVNVWYNVGSRNEVPGRTGFAHLFEQLLREFARTNQPAKLTFTNYFSDAKQIQPNVTGAK